MILIKVSFLSGQSQDAAIVHIGSRLCYINYNRTLITIIGYLTVTFFQIFNS